MLTENLSTLKIHKLTQGQYDRALSSGNIDPNALYLTPDEGVDLSEYATKEDLKSKADTEHEHEDYATTEYVDANFALKSEIGDVDLTDYETKEDAQLKYDTIVEAKADWNQKNETAIDYIKNRPFYDNTEIFLDTITVNNGDTINLDINGCADDSGGIVTVVWDGVSYDKEIGFCRLSGGIASPGYATLGNQIYFNALVSGRYFEDTGEEYLIATYDKDTTSVVYCDENPHTLSIIKYELVQIDEKFIPDTIARQEYVDSTFARKEDVQDVDLSNYETKEDAQIKYDTIVEAKADWNQNDEDAIDYVKNRTHYLEEEFTTYDFSTYQYISDVNVDLQPEENEYYHSWWAGLYDNEPIEYDKIIGSQITISDATVKNGTRNETFTITTEHIIDDRVDNNIVIIVYDYDEIIYDRVLIVYNNTIYNGVELNRGVWYIQHMVSREQYSRRDTFRVRNLTVPTQIYHTLSEEFIPETIARTSYVDENFALKSEIGNVDLSNYYTKDQIDNMEFITVEDIDAICGANIQYASAEGVKF